MMVGSAINAPRAAACTPVFVDAMCELHAETPSGTDEEELHQNIFNAFLAIVTSFQLGDRLQAYLTEEELRRVGL